ncbi:MAG TPA: hypothetical protein PLB89_01775 [Flavobacteriales bacterium]|nr:hypothetical protein [Flavobacteriales bacterium]
MKHALTIIQRRMEGLQGEEREVADEIILFAVRQIDVLREQRKLRLELDNLRSEIKADRSHKLGLTDKRDDEWLTSGQVMEVLGHERTYLWELGQVGLLKPYEKRGNVNRYRVRDLRRFLAIDAQLLGRTLNEWRAKNKGKML